MYYIYAFIFLIDKGNKIRINIILTGKIILNLFLYKTLYI